MADFPCCEDESSYVACPSPCSSDSTHFTNLSTSSDEEEVGPPPMKAVHVYRLSTKAEMWSDAIPLERLVSHAVFYFAKLLGLAFRRGEAFYTELSDLSCDDDGNHVWMFSVCGQQIFDNRPPHDVPGRLSTLLQDTVYDWCKTRGEPINPTMIAFKVEKLPSCYPEDA